MTRYDDLRRMREAKFQAKGAKPVPKAKPVTEIKMKSVTWGGKREGAGRPKTDTAMSAAEKMRRYRANKQAAGERIKNLHRILSY